ncbi:hypothetical protein UC8_01370 [Roseimaritima ulvae]|uniref:Uncharacterized protein n=1 Tax=Roseimaritima ulvae TaxID=980254 RepID=A0A5B9QH82_9BACT|nr:hypothetical protein UC8_01370 [Roseimaritima ulvae]
MPLYTALLLILMLCCGRKRETVARIGVKHRSKLVIGPDRVDALPHIEMFKWNSISDQSRAASATAKPKRDRMRLAYMYQALLDSGRCNSRAALARHLRVSRSRVTQVLNRPRPTTRVTDPEKSSPEVKKQYLEASPLLPSGCLHLCGRYFSVLVPIHLREHSLRIADGFGAGQDAVAITIDLFGMSFQKTAHRTS